jgi:IgA Peptidase M64/FG-GAP-like repeat
MADSMTPILLSGPPGTKINIAVLGDGFAAGDQATYNSKVQEFLTDGVFGHDYFYEDKQAFNIYRVNLISVDSGVSTRVYDEHGTPDDPSDDTIVSTTIKNTSLGYIFSGSWAHCWLEGGANTNTLVQNALNTWVPDYNLVVIFLNDPRYGGCGGGGFQVVPLGISWQVLAHEFGHGLGALADEYCTSRVYSGGEPGNVNVTINTNRTTLKWKRFVHPATPVPTGVGSCAGYTQGTRPADWDDTQSVGLFEGGGTNGTGMYRPVINCRMRSNTPEYCPVCYTHMKQTNDPKTEHTFLDCHTGDFNGDGKDDLLVHNGNSIQIFRSNGSQLDIVFSATERVPGSWQFTAGDQFFIGDFNGDGKDECAVYNSTNWAFPYLGLLADDGHNGLHLIARYDGSMPGWQFQTHDRFYVADFDGDGKDDLVVFNGPDWAMPYLGMLRSSGSSFNVVHRYDRNLPSWQMTPGDQFYVGDFSGGGKDDLFVFNGSNWAFPYLGMLQSTGSSLTMAHRYDHYLPSWQMTPHDRLYVGDFDGDGKADVYIANGQDWSIAYLGMLRSNGSSLSMAHRYDGAVPGWQMRAHDQFWVGDINADGRADLFVYNSNDWATQYLGTMISGGASLSASWTADWVGEWNLGTVDRFEPCDFEGVGGRRDLIVHNHDWLGLIRATPALLLQKIYYRWIHNYRYGRNW